MGTKDFLHGPATVVERGVFTVIMKPGTIDRVVWLVKH